MGRQRSIRDPGQRNHWATILRKLHAAGMTYKGIAGYVGRSPKWCKDYVSNRPFPSLTPSPGAQEKLMALHGLLCGAKTLDTDAEGK